MAKEWWAENVLVRQWRLTRNCTMTPRAFVLHLCTIVGVLAVLGTVFGLLGSLIVAAFCVLQIFVVIASGLAFAVHAADGEHITLYPDKLVVQWFDGLHECHHELHPCWVRIERGQGADKDRFWLSEGKTRLPLGRHLPTEQRYRAVSEITRALLSCHAAAAPHRSSNAVRSDPNTGNSTTSTNLHK